MAGWKTHNGTALALPVENIDTDQLIPARFMSAPRSQGYGDFLLYDLRHDTGGQPNDMPLNACPQTSILVTRRNFGSGSSRETAVYALVDFGIRAVIAPSFGDIFASNAVNNGLLPAQVDDTVVEELIEELGQELANASVDLENSKCRIGKKSFSFRIDPVWRLKLMNGWDDIDLSGSHADQIASFAAERRAKYPWAWPGK
jgi:3-isopropylmalate/(R)-2-methylmalate dehydratase small subunit